jgi:hypothetical protein
MPLSVTRRERFILSVLTVLLALGMLGLVLL